MYYNDMFEKDTFKFHLFPLLSFVGAHYTSNLPTQETSYDEEDSLGLSTPSIEKKIEKGQYCELPCTNEIEHRRHMISKSKLIL